MQVKCYFCNNDFETSFRNHGILYNNKKIYICKDCLFIDLKCDICGKDFKMKRIRYENSNRKLLICSQNCSRKYATEKMKAIPRFKGKYFCEKCGKETNHYKNGQCVVCLTTKVSNTNQFKEVICEICGEKFQLFRSSQGIFMDDSYHKICDKCNKKEVKCEQCGEVFYAKLNSTAKFCSQKCSQMNACTIMNQNNHTPEANKKRENALIASGAAQKRNERLKTFYTDKEHQTKAGYLAAKHNKEIGQGFYNNDIRNQGTEKQKLYWKIYNSNDVVNKFYSEAKIYCENIMKTFDKNRDKINQYWQIYNSNDIDNNLHHQAKSYCDNMISILENNRNLALEKIKLYWQIYNSNDVDNDFYPQAKVFCESVIKNLQNIIYKRDESGRIISINDTPWDEYCKNYIISDSNNVDFSKLGFKRINFDESEIKLGYPTLAWKQRFTDVCEYPWVVYIKYCKIYFINNNNKDNFDKTIANEQVSYESNQFVDKPLVARKTGTNDVLASGPDVVFDYKMNIHGTIRPARQFLNDNNLEWNKSFIDYKCFQTEKEALQYELYVQNKFNLFKS